MHPLHIEHNKKNTFKIQWIVEIDVNDKQFQ